MARIDVALERLLNQFEDADESIIEIFRAIFNRIAEVDALLEGLLLYRWLDTAEGVWLDVIGTIVGISRPAESVSPSIIFTYKSIGDPNDPNKGYGTLPQTNSVGLYNSVFGLSTNQPANDDEYRQRIKAKVAVTGVGVAYPDIYRFIRNTFNVEPHLSSPYTGRVEIELDSWISNQDRFFLIESVPVSAGIEIEIMNWPTPP